MKKFAILSLLLVIAGCGGSSKDTDNLSLDEPIEIGCAIGEYRSDDRVSFEVCSVEPVSYDEIISETQLNIKFATTKVGEVWLSSHNDNVYDVDFAQIDDLKEAIQLVSGEEYSFNTIDVSGYEVFELELPEDLAASTGVSKSYWFYTGEELLLFRDNFNAVAFISGLKLK